MLVSPRFGLVPNVGHGVIDATPDLRKTSATVFKVGMGRPALLCYIMRGPIPIFALSLRVRLPPLDFFFISAPPRDLPPRSCRSTINRTSYEMRGETPFDLPCSVFPPESLLFWDHTGCTYFIVT